MSRKFFQRYMPDPHAIRHNRNLRIFGSLLHDANLWHLNRRSISNAFAVGLFFAWWPVPFQMILAAAGAILFRANLPISIGLVWITNPFTMPPMFYFAYLLGAWILGTPEMAFDFEPTWAWLSTGLLHIWKPFLTGCLVMGVSSALLGYFGVRLSWRYSVIKRRNQRRYRYLKP